MSTVELKSNLHKLVDKITNEDLLLALHDFLKFREHASPGNLWTSLTDDEKKEVMLSYEESKDDQQLVRHKTIDPIKRN